MTEGIAVVVVSFNTRVPLRSCLKAYLPQIGPDDQMVVIDNQSTDGTCEMMRDEFPNVRLIVSPRNAGFSFACNTGYRATTCPFVLFSNGDITVPERFVENVRAKMQSKPQVGILSPELRSEDGRLIQMSWGWNLSFLGEFTYQFLSPRNMASSRLIRRIVRLLQLRELEVPVVTGACMLLRREMLDKVGGMDENFELYFEDADLCVRCQDAGYAVLFSPAIQVFHGLGQSGKSIQTKIELVYRQSQIYFYRKHNTRLELAMLKLYLAMKFFVVRRCWRDPVFFRWFKGILLEQRRLRLVDTL